MKLTPQTIRNEPLLIGGGIIAILSQFGNGLVREAAATAVSYGVNVTPQAETLLTTIVTITILIAGMLVTRQFTAPAHKLDELSKSQFRQPPPTED